MMEAPIRKRIPLRWIDLLVIALIAATVFILLVNLVDYTREVSKRINCSNNMRQIGIATVSYSTTEDFFPEDFERDGRSFYAAILDGVGEIDLLPEGSVNPNAVVKPFVCPGRRRPEDVPGACDFGYVESNGIRKRDRTQPFEKDGQKGAGAQNTAMLSHIWISPNKYSVAEPRWASWTGHSIPYSKAIRGYRDTDPAGIGGFGSPHPMGLPTVFADGHVGMLPYTHPQFRLLWDYSNSTIPRRDVP